MKSFTIKNDRQFLMRRMGDISQIAGTKRYELIDGKAKGIEAVDVRTGSGFRFTVLPGRGMDIAWADFKGVPISYISKTGVVAPQYYESRGVNWLRSFFAGLLTTCGLSNVGWPCEVDHPTLGSLEHGLHGRIANMAADNVCVGERWQGDDLIMEVSGRVREAMLHAENLVLERQITTALGQNKLTVHDTVENAGFQDQPLMILYHINLGYPVLDENSRFVCNSQHIIAANQEAQEDLESYDTFHGPRKGCKEGLYFHDVNAQSNGSTMVGIINDDLELGVYVSYNKNQLGQLAQWKTLAEAEYVLGIEPGNCLPVGQVEQKKRGDLEYIKAGEVRQFDLEIGLLTDQQQIEQFEHDVKSLKC